MNDIAIRLSLQVPGAGMLSSQECEQNPKESYNIHKVPVVFTKGKGKFQKTVKQILTVKTRKQRLITQNISICKEAYDYMLETPANGRISQEKWIALPEKERLKAHLDQIAQDLKAVSYTYEILDD